MQAHPLRVVVVGLGRWGPNHVRTFSSVADAEVVAGVDSDPDARERLRLRFADVPCTDELAPVLASEEVDAVVVATPTESHAEIVEQALSAGKHVLCEKPISHRSDLAWRLARLARERGRQLMVGHIFLFNPGIQCLCREAATEQVGRRYYVKAVRTNLGPFRSDVNAAWDLASHDIYIFSALLGARPLAVSAVGSSYLRQPVEDIVFITLRYPDNVIGHVHVSWLDPRKVRHITVVGEEAMVTWDEFGSPGPVMVHDRTVVREPHYDTFGEFQLLARQGNVVIPPVASREPLAEQTRAFIRRCRGEDPGAVAGCAGQAAEVVDVLSAVSRSLVEEGRLVEVEYGGD
jgi:predicted dehydrogenase